LSEPIPAAYGQHRAIEIKELKMVKSRRGERRQEILETLARMLQENHGERITTAELARAVGVSEAALYRHFPSKAKMFEGLIEFIEDALFTRINRILDAQPLAQGRLEDFLFLILGFADKNPGMARILYGDVLTGETERLRRRVAQIFERIETQLRQILREAEISEGLRLPVADASSLMLAIVEGRIGRLVRSGFKDSPLNGWERQWDIVCKGVFDNSQRRVAGVSGGADAG
jgi:TetR/AcrR family transcriptional regulator